MATVVADMSMSLDGFVAGPNDELDVVFSWYMAGDVAVETENPELAFKVDEAEAAVPRSFPPPSLRTSGGCSSETGLS